MVRRLSGTKAIPARRAAAVLPKFLRSPAHDKCAAVGLDLAEQNPRQLQLSASHEAVDAEHFAGARLERDVLQAAGERQLVGLQDRRTIARWRQRDVVRIGLLQRLVALADHRFDQGGLAGRGGFRLGYLRPLRNTVTVSETRKMSSMKWEMKTMPVPSSRRRRKVVNRRSTSGGERAEVGSSRMMSGRPRTARGRSR